MAIGRAGVHTQVERGRVERRTRERSSVDRFIRDALGRRPVALGSALAGVTGDAYSERDFLQLTQWRLP